MYEVFQNKTGQLMVIQREPGWVYGTKVTGKNGESYGGFLWPQEIGVVKCPDWNPEPECGGGLHFWEDGCGDIYTATISEDSQWRLVRAKEQTVVQLGGKVKSSEVEVLMIGDCHSVCKLMVDLAPNKQVHYGTATAGNWGTATAGYKGTATAGYKGTATAGYKGTATAGEWGTATAGEGGTATAGYNGTATAGKWGTATAGELGTATAGNWGTATAGNWGTATAGEGGTATAGYKGTATAGYKGTATAGEGGTATAGNWGMATAGEGGTATAGYKGTATAGYNGTATAGKWGTATAGELGTATAGEGGIIQIEWWDGKRKRIMIAYSGEDGVEPQVAYKLDSNGKFVRA